MDKNYKRIISITAILLGMFCSMLKDAKCQYDTIHIEIINTERFPMLPPSGIEF